MPLLRLATANCASQRCPTSAASLINPRTLSLVRSATSRSSYPPSSLASLRKTSGLLSSSPVQRRVATSLSLYANHHIFSAPDIGLFDSCTVSHDQSKQPPVHYSPSTSLSSAAAVTFGHVRTAATIELLLKSPIKFANMATTVTARTQQQTRTSHSHGGHDHNHAHDNTYLVSSNKKDAGVRITRIGLYVNLGMAIGKAVGGYVFNSKALLADAIHSLTDLIADLMTLATVSWSLHPPTDKFPNAYGKIESLGSLGVSGVLLATGFLMGWSSLFELAHIFIPGLADALAAIGLSAGHGHHHGVDEASLGPNINAAWLAAGSILIKEWLYRATLKIAKQRKSAVLAANAYHHRVDSLTAVVALVMIGGSHLVNNAAWLDPVGGVIISLMIVQAGYGSARDSLYELADVAIDEDMKEEVTVASLTALEELGFTHGADQVDIRLVSGMKAGQNFLIDLELGVPASWTVEQNMKVEKFVRDRVGLEVKGVKKVKFRFVPRETGKPQLDDEFISPEVMAKQSAEPKQGHDHQNGHPHSH